MNMIDAGDWRIPFVLCIILYVTSFGIIIFSSFTLPNFILFFIGIFLSLLCAIETIRELRKQ